MEVGLEQVEPEKWPPREDGTPEVGSYRELLSSTLCTVQSADHRGLGKAQAVGENSRWGQDRRFLLSFFFF